MYRTKFLGSGITVVCNSVINAGIMACDWRLQKYALNISVDKMLKGALYFCKCPELVHIG